MGILIKRSKILTLLLGSFFLLASCDSNRVFDKYIAVEDNNWLKDSKIDFEFQITDTISRNNLFINIRNNKDYEYSNLYLIAHLDFPNGKKIVDTLQYEMANKNGKFLGSGLSEIKENKLFYKENSIFPVSGNYKVSIRHAMRKNGNVEGIEKLQGISDVGFRIEKVK